MLKWSESISKKFSALKSTCNDSYFLLCRYKMFTGSITRLYFPLSKTDAYGDIGTSKTTFLHLSSNLLISLMPLKAGI